MAAENFRWKKVACPLQVGGEFLPQVEEFKYLGVLFMSEGRMEREIDRRSGAASAVMRLMVCRGEEGAELQGKALDLPVNLRSYSHLWLWAVGHDRKDKIPDTGGRNELSPQGGWALPLRDRVRSSVTWEELRIEPLVLDTERSQLRWIGHLFRMPPGRPPGEVFRARPTGRRPPGKTQDTLEGFMSPDWPGNTSVFA